MSEWHWDWSRHGAIGAGLAVGSAAKYGVWLAEGQKLSWRGLLGDVLMLGMLGLLAIVTADTLQLSGDWRVLVGALAAVSGDRLIRLASRHFLSRFDAALRAAPPPSSPPSGDPL